MPLEPKADTPPPFSTAHTFFSSLLRYFYPNNTGLVTTFEAEANNTDFGPTFEEESAPEFIFHVTTAIEDKLNETSTPINKCQNIQDTEANNTDFGPTFEEESDPEFISHVTTTIEDKLNETSKLINKCQNIQDIENLANHIKQLLHLVGFAAECLKKNDSPQRENELFNFSFGRHEIAQLCESFMSKFRDIHAFKLIIKTIETDILKFPTLTQTLDEKDLIDDNRLKLNVTSHVLGNMDKAIAHIIEHHQNSSGRTDTSENKSNTEDNTRILIDTELEQAISHYFTFIRNHVMRQLTDTLSKHSISNTDNEKFLEISTMLGKMKYLENHTCSVFLRPLEDKLLTIKYTLSNLIERYLEDDNILTVKIDEHCSWCLELMELNLVADEIDETRLERAKLRLDTELFGHYIESAPNDSPRPTKSSTSLFGFFTRQDSKPDNANVSLATENRLTTNP